MYFLYDTGWLHPIRYLYHHPMERHNCFLKRYNKLNIFHLYMMVYKTYTYIAYIMQYGNEVSSHFQQRNS